MTLEDILARLVENLDDSLVSDTPIIPWASPILSFGDAKNSRIATVGLNPSNLEFVNSKDEELSGALRRFPTINSLSLTAWNQTKPQHIHQIIQFCNNYFIGNPYDFWFKKLDLIISGTGHSFYFPTQGACHLDLVPYSTFKKWSEISSQEKTILFERTKFSLGEIIKLSPIEILVLNGESVVRNFETMFNLRMVREHMPTWALPRKESSVAGYSYHLETTSLGEVDLNRKLIVLGYNHNIQSSFGVSSRTLLEIKNWISYKVRE